MRGGGGRGGVRRPLQLRERRDAAGGGRPGGSGSGRGRDSGCSGGLALPPLGPLREPLRLHERVDQHVGVARPRRGSCCGSAAFPPRGAARRGRRSAAFRRGGSGCLAASLLRGCGSGGGSRFLLASSPGRSRRHRRGSSRRGAGLSGCGGRRCSSSSSSSGCAVTRRPHSPWVPAAAEVEVSSHRYPSGPPRSRGGGSGRRRRGPCVPRPDDLGPGLQHWHVAQECVARREAEYVRGRGGSGGGSGGRDSRG